MKLSGHIASVAAALVILTCGFHVTYAQIHNVTVGTGAEQSLILATLTSGTQGAVCFLNDTSVGDAVCAVLLGMPRVTRAVARLFTGTTGRAVSAALDGCPYYRADQTGRWNLNTDCNVITGPIIPAVCRNRMLSVDCVTVNVTLRHGTDNEGLVMVTFNGTTGTVCASGSGMREAAAVCRSLGLPNPERGIPLIGRYRPDIAAPDENVTLIESLECDPGATLSTCRWQSLTGSNPDCLRGGNRLAVSCPAFAPTPKPLPSPVLQCFRQRAVVCFKSSTLASRSDLRLMLNASLESPCSAGVEFENRTATGDLCMLVHNYTSCAEVTADLAAYTEYLLVVQFGGELDAAGNYVRPQMNFPLYCQVSKESLATGASLIPEAATPTSAKDGHVGGFVVVELFRDLINGILGNQVSGSVEVGTTLFAGVIMRGASANSWLVVNNCWAVDGPLNATLVRNKCPAAGHVALIPVNASVIAVRFQAFLFNSTGGSGRMSIVCTAVTCRQGDPSLECSRACTGAFARFGDNDGSAGGSEHHVTRSALLTVYNGSGGGGDKSAGRTAATEVDLLTCVTIAFILLMKTVVV